MRALLGILCLFAFSPAERLAGRPEATRPERLAALGALLAEIAPPEVGQAKDLPRDLDEALTAWIEPGAGGRFSA